MIMILIFNIIFYIKKKLNMSFRDILTTTATSGMEPSRILFDGLQALALADRGVTGGFSLVVVSSDERKQISQKALRGEPNSSTGAISSF